MSEMTIAEALEVLRKSIQTDDNSAWEALDLIEQALEDAENSDV